MMGFSGKIRLKVKKNDNSLSFDFKKSDDGNIVNFTDTTDSVTILGENLTIAAGGLPADVFHVDLLIEESQFSKAIEVISKYEEKLKLSSKGLDSWKCNDCDNLNPNSFEICWNCQSSK